MLAKVSKLCSASQKDSLLSTLGCLMSLHIKFLYLPGWGVILKISALTWRFVWCSLFWIFLEDILSPRTCNKLTFSALESSCQASSFAYNEPWFEDQTNLALFSDVQSFLHQSFFIYLLIYIYLWQYILQYQYAVNPYLYVWSLWEKVQQHTT